jgi:hypothetical protein
MNSQIAFHRQFSIPNDANVLGFEMQGRKLLHIKEIRALQQITQSVQSHQKL